MMSMGSQLVGLGCQGSPPNKLWGLIPPTVFMTVRRERAPCLHLGGARDVKFRRSVRTTERLTLSNRRPKSVDHDGPCFLEAERSMVTTHIRYVDGTLGLQRQREEGYQFIDAHTLLAQTGSRVRSRRPAAAERGGGLARFPQSLLPEIVISQSHNQASGEIRIVQDINPKLLPPPLQTSQLHPQLRRFFKK